MDTPSFGSHSISRHSSVTSDSPKALPAFHQYSCTRCRTRKVKCDKVVGGCIHCRKAGVQCMYSARRSRKAQKLHREVAMRPLLPTDSGLETITKNRNSPGFSTGAIASLDEHNTDDDNANDDYDEEDRLIPREMRDASFQSRFDIVQSDQGRLFVSQGKSRYVNGQKASQLAKFEQVLFAEPAVTDDHPIRSSHTSIDSHGSGKWWTKSSSEKLAGSSLLQVSNSRRSLRGNHPTLDIQRALWDYYTHTVDLLVKIIYKPAAEALYKRALDNPGRVDPATEAFLFAIYFAAVTTMSSEECARIHQAERSVLLQKYQSALEQALVDAGWMTTQDVVVLQAMILLMVCTPRKNVRSTWMLIGSAMGIAQAMGMHRDSAAFALSTAEVELRRRIWWTLCLLDNRISQDCGLDPHVPVTMDTKLPLHVNDSDISADATGAPLPRTGFTEMTISLVKLEMVEFTLKLKMSQYSPNPLGADQMEALAREKSQHYRNTYLQYLDPTLHLHRVCSLGTRLIVANFWKLTYDQCRRLNTAVSEDRPEIKEGLLRYNTEVLEITHQLPDRSSQFGWFFSCKYTQWHAMAYLLLELRHHLYSNSPAVDRAWEVLDAVFRDINNNQNNHLLAGALPQKSKLWQSLSKLSEKLRQIRKQAIIQSQLSHRATPDEESTYAAAFDSGYETNVSNEEQSVKHAPVSGITGVANASNLNAEDVLLGDPFLGSIQNFDFDLIEGDKMNWDGFDTLISNWQTDLVQQPEYMDHQGNNPTIALNWW